MDDAEKEIFRYLRGAEAGFVPVTAISRHAGGKHKYRETPDWAKPVLLRMVERGILELDANAAYRLKPLPAVDPARRWVSPQIAEMLRKSGKKFDGMIQPEGDVEAFYDSL